jgi:membrane protease YdiL (CAAX protease family)
MATAKRSPKTKHAVASTSLITRRTHLIIAALKPLLENFWIFLWIALVVIAGQVSLFSKPIVGVYVTSLAFVALIGLALWKEKARQLAISAAVLPIAIMINLSLPQTTTFTQTIVFYDTLLIIGLIYRFMFTLDETLTNTKLSRRCYIITLPLMIIIGQFLGLLGFILLRHQYTFGHTSLPLVAVATVVFAISEATLFQGLIQQRAAKILHPIMAAILSVILYTSFTFGHTGSYLAPLFGCITGIILAVAYYKKQNLLLVITINAAAKLAYIGLMAGFVFR